MAKQKVHLKFSMSFEPFPYSWEKSTEYKETLIKVKCSGVLVSSDAVKLAEFIKVLVAEKK